MADQGVRPGANQFVIFVQAGSHAKLPAQVLNGGPRQHGCHPRENRARFPGGRRNANAVKRARPSRNNPRMLGVDAVTRHASGNAGPGR
jgi:hypothetical protein